MKKILINKKWLDVYHTLTRNQILLSIILTLNKNTGKYLRMLYRSYGDKRLLDDLEALKPYNYYNFNNDNNLTKEEIKEYGGYFKIKHESFYLLMNSSPTKQELLVFLWIESLYVIEQKREYTFKLGKVLKEVFKHYKNPSNQRDQFINALQKFKDWKYECSDVLIRDYKIDEGYLTLILDTKTRKRNPYKQFKKK